MLWSLQKKGKALLSFFGLFSLQAFCLREAVFPPRIYGLNSEAMRVCSAAPTAPGVSAQIQSISFSQGLSRPRSNHSRPKAPKACQPEALGCHFPGAREAGTGPELTPTRVGEGGGAAVPAAGAGRGPGTGLEKGRDHAMLAVTASQGAGCQGTASPPWGPGRE